MRGVLRLVGIEVVWQGFAFCVLEGDRLIYFGSRTRSADTSVLLRKLGGVLERYRADVLVLEEPAGCGRGARAVDWLSWAEEYAVERGLTVRAITHEDIERTFGESVTTFAIAQAVGRQFPRSRFDLHLCFLKPAKEDLLHINAECYGVVERDIEGRKTPSILVPNHRGLILVPKKLTKLSLIEARFLAVHHYVVW